ncbi:MAG: Ig-like domain-containing protein [Muribaculaceae bacterium]|nr:Ig-like domain-containing protein [Muribaculaceae bacterium]
MTKTRLIPIILTLCAAVAFDASARYKGDLNGDDRVDLADMVYLAKAIQSGSTDKALDVNASGSVDDYDLQRLADIIISGKLTEDSGMNVGIGGWEETDEDFGGTVKAPAFTTRSADETRFYMRSPRSESDGCYSMELGIAEGNEAPAAILFNIRLPREMKFEGSKAVELDTPIAASHKLYGSPKFIKENEDDDWSEYSLRFIVFSPDLNALPKVTGKLGQIFYSVGDCWGTPIFVNCQAASANNGSCTDIPEHWSDYYGNYMPVEVSSVWFDQSEMNLVEGDENWIFANIDPWDATDQNLVWTSSDESVAMVSTEDGRNAVVKAVKAGEATITATTSNGISASCVVRVEKRFVDVWGIYLNQDNLNMTEGDSATLTATIDPVDATDQTINWSSSDESIAVVNADGAKATVTALAPGYVEIYASASNGMTATCHINVEARFIEVTAISLDQSELNLTEGDTAWLNATVSPDDATDKTLTWTSSDASVVRVSENGEVNALKAGTATITVSTANGKTATCIVTVEPKVIEMQSITLDAEELALEVGDTHQFIATVLPAETTYPELEWWTDDETVATVDQNGFVIMVGEGSATLHVRSVRWPDIEATCRLNVTDAVDCVIADDAPCDIYTTNGKLLKQSVPTSEIRKLDRGLYIIRQRGKTTKLLK